MKRLFALFVSLTLVATTVGCGSEDTEGDSPQIFTVIFDAGASGGEFPDGETQIEKEVEEGETVSKPEDDPVREDHVFDGWYRTDNEDKWDFKNDTVTEDISLVAGWTEESDDENQDDSLEIREKKWTGQFDGAFAANRYAMAVDDQERIYVGDRDFRVFDSDGNLEWEFNSSIKGFAIDDDGVVYATTGNGSLYAFDPEEIEVVDGSVEEPTWAFEFEGRDDTSPAIGPNGTIYFATISDRLVYAVQPPESSDEGPVKLGTFYMEELEEEDEGGSASPVIDDEGVVYVGGSKRTGVSEGEEGAMLYALAPPQSEDDDFERLWSVDLGSHFRSSPALDDEGRLFLNLQQGLHVIDSTDDNPSETFENLNPSGLANPFSGPSIGKNGEVFKVTDSTGRIRAYDSTSENYSRLWNVSPEDSGLMQTTPAVDADGTVYVSTHNQSGDEFLYALDPETGEEQWIVEIGPTIGTPVIFGDTLYLTTYSAGNGALIAVDIDAEGPADSPWPMWGGDHRRTGTIQ